MKNPQKLIGRKIKWFEFEHSENVSWLSRVSNYIGIDGTIEIYDKEDNCFGVRFNSENSFFYPADQIEAHLVNEENEIPTLSDGVMMLVSNNKQHYGEEKVWFVYGNQYYIKNGLNFEPVIYCKPIEKEPTKEEQLTVILGSSDKVKEIMEVFNENK